MPVERSGTSPSAALVRNMLSIWKSISIPERGPTSKIGSGGYRSDVGLVMLEGVSPYIERWRFEQFLRMLARTLNQSSQLAYDYKAAGVDDQFGAQTGEAVFRLSRDRAVTEAFLCELGFQLMHFENSADLISGLPDRRAPQGVRISSRKTCCCSSLRPNDTK